MKENTCCFFGHRQIEDADKLRMSLYTLAERLITERNIDTFLFGSKSKFNSLCHETVSLIKEKYPHIKRVYVRAEFPYIDKDYERYLLQSYEKTYFPEHIIGAGHSAYVKRNFEMIDKSSICIVYYSPDYTPPRRRAANNLLNVAQPKSGTKIAYDYAVKRGKEIINLKK